jgi:thiamine biosynthesis lipoprotein
MTLVVRSRSLKVLAVRPALLVLALSVLVLLLGCGHKAIQPITLHGSTMGTTWSVVIPSPAGLDKEPLKLEIQSSLDKLNKLMSTYLPNSELSLFNKQQSTQWLEVDQSLVKLVSTAAAISDLTQGGFDITVGPLVNLWGFGPGKTSENLVPDQAKLQQALSRVGYKDLAFREKPASLKKQRADLYVDLSSIAKGYGVDQIALLLESKGIADYLVEIGGELKAKGLSARQDAWKIGIEKPLVGERSIEQAVKLSDGALATSGDYRNYFESKGKRYSHTLDARSGYPISHKLAAVSVFHKSCASADAWATALMVLGEEQGFELAQKLKLAAYFIYKKDDGFKSVYTDQFKPLLMGQTK